MKIAKMYNHHQKICYTDFRCKNDRSKGQSSKAKKFCFESLLSYNYYFFCLLGIPTSDAYTTALLRIRVTSQKCRKFNVWRKSAFAKRNGYAAASIKSKTLKASPLSNRRSARPAERRSRHQQALWMSAPTHVKPYLLSALEIEGIYLSLSNNANCTFAVFIMQPTINSKKLSIFNFQFSIQKLSIFNLITIFVPEV